MNFSALLAELKKNELEEMYRINKRISLTGYGVLIISDDCPEEWLYSVYESINIKGKVKCSENVKKHYCFKK